MDHVCWFQHGCFAIWINSSIDKKFNLRPLKKNGSRQVVCPSWTRNDFYLKVGAEHCSLSGPNSCPPHQIDSCLVWDRYSWPRLWPVGCLKTLLDHPVPLKPSLCQGPVTHFPTMIWKISGQIHSCPTALLHAVAVLFVPGGHLGPQSRLSLITMITWQYCSHWPTAQLNHPDCVYPWPIRVVVSWSTLVWMNQFNIEMHLPDDPEPWLALTAWHAVLSKDSLELPMIQQLKSGEGWGRCVTRVHSDWPILYGVHSDWSVYKLLAILTVPLVVSNWNGLWLL